MTIIQRNTCLSCSSDALEDTVYISREGVPHGQEEHRITYSTVAGVRCESCHAVFFESYDHDCFQYDEPWNMAWYALLEDFAALENALQLCPDALDPTCECELHEKLRESNPGYWGQRANYSFYIGSVRYATIRAVTDPKHGTFTHFERIEEVGVRHSSG